MDVVTQAILQGQINTNETAIATNTQDISELLAKSMLLKKSGILTQAAASIALTTDNDGKALSLVKAQLVLYVPAGTEQDINMRINGITASAYYYGGNAGASTFNVGKVSTLYYNSRISMDVLGGAVDIDANYAFTTSEPAVTSTSRRGGLYAQSITSISGILLYGGLSADLPIGTSYKLYGVDAS